MQKWWSDGLNHRIIDTIIFIWTTSKNLATKHRTLSQNSKCCIHCRKLSMPCQSPIFSEKRFHLTSEGWYGDVSSSYNIPPCYWHSTTCQLPHCLIKGVAWAKMVKIIKFLFFVQRLSSGMGASHPKFLGG